MLQDSTAALVLLGAISANPSSRFNSLCALYRELSTAYGNPAIYFYDLGFQIPDRYNQDIVSKTNILLKSLKISNKKNRNKQYNETCKKKIMLKIFQCLFYFIGNTLCIQQIEKDNHIEYILDNVKKFKLPNCSLIKHTKTNKMRKTLTQQLFLTSFVQRIIICSNHPKETCLIYFTTKFYLNMASIHQTLVNFLEKIYYSMEPLISLTNLMERNFECIISFLLQLFKSTNIRIQCSNCFSKLFKHIAFLFEFIYEQNQNAYLIDNQDKLLLMLLQILSLMIASGDEREEMIQCIVNHKICKDNSYFIDWIFKNIVEHKSLKINKVFWKFIKNLCIDQWPDRFYELNYFEDLSILPVSIMNFIEYSDVLNITKFDAEMVKDICYILQTGLNDAGNTRAPLQNVWLFPFCQYSLLSNRCIIIPLLKLYRKNKNRNDFELITNILSLFLSDSLVTNTKCFCVELAQLVAIGVIEMCIEMIKKSMSYISQHLLNCDENADLLDSAGNLFIGCLFSLKVVLKHCSNKCTIHSKNDLHTRLATTKKQFELYTESIYLPYPSKNLSIYDNSVSFNHKFPMEHHLIKCYPQYFVWKIKKCDGFHVLNQVIKFKNWLESSESLDQGKTVVYIQESTDYIFEFAQIYDIDEKQMEIDLIDLKIKIESIEHRFYPPR